MPQINRAPQLFPVLWQTGVKRDMQGKNGSDETSASLVLPALNPLPLFFYRSNRTGRTEMTSLANKWANLQSLDFVKLRERLGV